MRSLFQNMVLDYAFLRTTGAPSTQRSKAHFPFRVKRRIKKGWPVKRPVPSRTKFKTMTSVNLDNLVAYLFSALSYLFSLMKLKFISSETQLAVEKKASDAKLRDALELSKRTAEDNNPKF
ncbi:hypothetical protein RJT34_19723 [Clitoria ternatea]|uniref:Uncharacterized protein n=1 Tax=Clitoria ternatea TaxID=43366 RepID=A0AAN9IRQ2_CLITE